MPIHWPDEPSALQAAYERHQEQPATKADIEHLQQQINRLVTAVEHIIAANRDLVAAIHALNQQK